MKGLRLYIIASGCVAMLAVFLSWQINPACPPEGRGRKRSLDKAEKQLNRFKNRNRVPYDSEINRSISLGDILNSKDDSLKFDQRKAVVVEGYLYKAMSEEGESCNCYSEDNADHDTHICLSREPVDSLTKLADCMVIETTPYSRRLHPEWTTRFINKQFKKKKVRVTGWLLYDFKHRFQSQQSRPNGRNNKRRTVWEIHPVTNIELIK